MGLEVRLEAANPIVNAIFRVNGPVNAIFRVNGLVNAISRVSYCRNRDRSSAVFSASLQ